MRQRNTLFKRAKRSGTHQDYARFRQARNKLVGELRTAKSAYFHKLNPSNPRQFWKAVKHLNKSSSSIPVLTHNDVTHDSDEAKANVLNSFFSSCFNNSVPALHPLDCNLSALHHTPHLQKDIAMLEKTQQFASRICTKNWDAGYHELLDRLDLPSLAQRRLHTRLCYVYKIVHGLLYFPPDVVVPSSALSHNPHSHLLYQPFAHTNSYLHSFIPNSVSNWNMLPDYVVSSPSFTSFKYNLSLFTL